MKLIRFIYKNSILQGILEGDRIITEPSVEDVKLSDVVLLAPTVPTKVVAAGLNYKDHARELDMPIPDEPIIFIKPATSVIGPGAVIEYPSSSQRVDYEAELAIVIKDKIKDIEADEAFSHILGYTCLNDVTARDLQEKDAQWTRAKSFDTFSPIGPWIETELDPSNLKISSSLNGELKQSSSTSELIFKVPELVAFISRVMTLLPGDVIATGTPPGIGPMNPGDEITVEIEGIGKLTNTVESKKI